jgi:hypothetical protein
VIKLLPPLTVTGTGIDQGLALHADGMQTVCRIRRATHCAQIVENDGRLRITDWGWRVM